MRSYYIVPSQRTRPKPRAEWWEDEPFLPSLSVYEPDESAHDTGLVDHRGNTLYAITERDPIGFGHPLEDTTMAKNCGGKKRGGKGKGK